MFILNCLIIVIIWMFCSFLLKFQWWLTVNRFHFPLTSENLTRIDKNCAFTKKRARLWEKYSIWFMYFACLLSSEWTFLCMYICEKSIKKEEDAEDVCQLILETNKEFFLSLFSHCQLSVYFDFESPTFSWQMVCDG